MKRETPGVDNIPKELLKYGDHELTKELTVQLNEILKMTPDPKTGIEAINFDFQLWRKKNSQKIIKE